ncbi:SRPBCC family protein [Allostreptomyces psammosilenae]|uniref:Coenzyme Q-binding protein COQ10 START domain-containing protein n=1 Tax=Allostreptomyces psammosilenae TaxID=1892865 RepID=A0A852ZXH4_9ACTN|nr:SRPBCC family protein [Allostreptomyces psammosilenae]NYI07046.1 hypothetical protein [Allostreptomyces psammosilenae]
MADSTRSSTVVAAPLAQVLKVIVDFAGYPEWAGEIREAEVLSRGDDGYPERVRFVLDAGAIRDEHTLAYTFSVPAPAEGEKEPAGAAEVRWTLVTSRMLRVLDGSYTLRPTPTGTEVVYELSADTAVPMLGMLRRKAEKRIVDRALSGLRARVEG